MIGCFSGVEPVSIFLWSAELSSASGEWGIKLMTHYWAIQSNFQECVILVTILGWGSWLLRFQKIVFVIHCFPPLLRTLSPLDTWIWRQTVVSSSQIIFPGISKVQPGYSIQHWHSVWQKPGPVSSICSIIISFTLCDVFTCVSDSACSYVLKRASQDDRFVTSGTCCRSWKHSFTFSLISAQPLSATAAFHFGAGLKFTSDK